MENIGPFLRAIEACILAMLREAMAGLSDDESIILAAKIHKAVDTVLDENGVMK